MSHRCVGPRLRAALVCCAVLLQSAVAAAGTWEVLDTAGEAIRILDQDGNVVAHQLPAASPEASGDGEAASASMEEPVSTLDPAGNRRIEADGTIVPLGGSYGPPSAPPASGTTAAAGDPPRLTIDSMTITGGYSSTYTPASVIHLIGRASVYTLSDGSTWRSGAGSYRRASGYLDHVELDGDMIRYVIQPPADGQLYQQTDFDSGDHSSQGVLGVAGPLVIEALRGSTEATMSGGVEIVSNEISTYGEPRFNFFSAVVGAVVPFSVTYQLVGGATWQPDTFDASFSYSYSGSVDFANPISVPLVVALEIRGSGQAPPDTELQYYATATYDNGATGNVTDVASWSVSPGDLATVDSGLLQTGTPPSGEAQLELRASYQENGLELETTKAVKLVDGGVQGLVDAWPTYQGNRGHTGYVPTHLEPEVFSIRWERDIAPGRSLHQVAAADGNVSVSASSRFVDQPSLWSLDARDGETLWSKNFGRASSINPPALAHGNVYIQTGKESSNGMPPQLHAFDAATGGTVFTSTFSAQWESYLAPTVFDGDVYINGGYYGGMYAFDAFSGQSQWYVNLPQYDDWTPAVDEIHAYAYVGRNTPGLYVHDRITGEFLFRIDDVNFVWNGWSMNLAPVLTGDGGVVAIHDGRLLRFDVAGRRIAWERQSSFVGQPSIREGVIYAVDGARLVACDAATGAELWSWQPSSGPGLRGEVLVTDSHAFVSTPDVTYALELLSRSEVWSHPAGGTLALGNETLYIASSTGRLTAVAMPDWTPATVVSLTIDAPAEVMEGSTAMLTARAQYDDGRVRNRTELADWSIEPADAAEIGPDGLLRVGELFSPEVPIVVRASYEEDGVVVTDDAGVELVIAVSVDDFIRRNLEGAIERKQAGLASLQEAREREDAARQVLREIRSGQREGPPSRPGAMQALRHLFQATFWGRFGEEAVQRSMGDLDESIEALDEEGSPADQPWWQLWR